MKRPVLCSVLVAGLMTAGCGTTVQQIGAAGQAGQGLPSNVGGNGLSQGSTGASTGGLTPPNATGSTTSGGGTGTGSATGSLPGGAPGTSGASGGSGQSVTGGSTSNSGPVALGITRTEVRVGIAYTKNAQGAEQFGVSGVTTGNIKATYEAVLADLNKRGGLFGRKVVPVWHTFDGTSTASGDQQAQEECATYVNDNKVYAALGTGSNETSRQCLLKGGVSGVILTTLTPTSSKVFARYPNYVEPATLSYDRFQKPWLDALEAQGYFDKGAKVGVVTMDEPGIKAAVDKILLPELKRRGHSPGADVVYVHSPSGPSEYGQTTSQISSAVLRMRTDQVTHLIVNDFAGTILPFFAPEAERQGYRPRYGLTTHSGAQVFLDSGTVPKEQLARAVGIGWYPMLDLPQERNTDSGPYSNPTRRRCLSMLNRDGINPTDSNSKTVALAICDNVWLLEAASKASKVATPGPTSFQTGLNSLGSTYTPGTAIGSGYFDASHHEGVGALRYWFFDSGCSCMSYKPALVKVP